MSTPTPERPSQPRWLDPSDHGFFAALWVAAVPALALAWAAAHREEVVIRPPPPIPWRVVQVLLDRPPGRDVAPVEPVPRQASRWHPLVPSLVLYPDRSQRSCCIDLLDFGISSLLWQRTRRRMGQGAVEGLLVQIHAEPDKPYDEEEDFDDWDLPGWRRSVDHMAGGVERCVTLARRTKPALEVRALLHLRVHRRRVEELSIEANNDGVKAIEACLRRSARSWRFGRGADGRFTVTATVFYPG